MGRESHAIVTVTVATAAGGLEQQQSLRQKYSSSTEAAAGAAGGISLLPERPALLPGGSSPPPQQLQHTQRAQQPDVAMCSAWADYVAHHADRLAALVLGVGYAIAVVLIFTLQVVWCRVGEGAAVGAASPAASCGAIRCSSHSTAHDLQSGYVDLFDDYE